MLFYDELREKATEEKIKMNMLEQFEKIGIPYKPFFVCTDKCQATKSAFEESFWRRQMITKLMKLQ